VRLVILLAALSLSGCLSVPPTVPAARSFTIDDAGHRAEVAPRIAFESNESNGSAAWRVDSPSALGILGSFNATRSSEAQATRVLTFLHDGAVDDVLPGGLSFPGLTGGDHVAARLEAANQSVGHDAGHVGDVAARREAVVFQAFPAAHAGWLVALWSNQAEPVRLDVSLPPDAVVSPVETGPVVVGEEADFHGGAALVTPAAGAIRGATFPLSAPTLTMIELVRAPGQHGALEARLAHGAHAMSLDQPADHATRYTLAMAWAASASGSLVLDQSGEQAEGDVFVLSARAPAGLDLAQDLWAESETDFG
jgi:hypothetical protein